jgi:hypothetical protein
MTLILSGTDGLSDVDGSAATPAIRGTDANTGIFFPAADTIAFSEGGVESMRIDSSGNVGIGTTSPAKRLSVVNATDATTVGTNSVITVQAGSSVNSVAEIGFSYGSWGGTNPIASLGYQITSNAGVGAGALTFSTRSVTTDTAPSERMRIDSSGNVGIGVAPTSYAGGSNRTLQIYNSASANAELRISNSTTGTGASVGALIQQAGNDMYVWNASNSFMSFGTNATERARIDSSGNLLVGASSVSGTTPRLYVKSAASSGVGLVARFQNSAVTDLFTLRDDGYTATGLGAQSPYNATIGLAANLHVFSGDGGLYRSTSSIKYKRDVENYTKGLEAVAALRPVFYKGINPIEGETVYAGFIAEEVHDAGMTEFVQYAGDGTPDALSYGNMVSLCIKAIQEMKAIIDTQASTITQLQADVAALKGTP